MVNKILNYVGISTFILASVIYNMSAQSSWILLTLQLREHCSDVSVVNVTRRLLCQEPAATGKVPYHDHILP